MNSSSATGGPRNASYDRDSPSAAVTKNVTVLALGLIINYINGTLVHTFRKHQILYLNPRYILFIHLVINDMLQLTTAISLFVSSYVFYRIDVSVCFIILILAIFTTINTPLNLAVMAVECYVAVCFPLYHAQLVTVRRTCVLIGCMWALSGASVLLDVFVLVSSQPARLSGSSVLCHRRAVFTQPISVANMEVSPNVYLAVVGATIFYTYIRIVATAKAARAAAKARKTVLLHGFQLLLCMLTYGFGWITHSLVALFPRHYLHVMFVCYVVVQVLPRLVSPVVYGLRDHTFKKYLRRYLLCE